MALPWEEAQTALIAQHFPEDAIDTATKVVKAESSGNIYAKNDNKNGSRDHGLFQINDINVPALQKAGIIKSRNDLYDPETNVKAAAYLHQQQGFKPWKASQKNWDNQATSEAPKLMPWEEAQQAMASQPSQPQITPQQQKALDMSNQLMNMGMGAANQIAMNTKAPQYAAPGVAGKAALVGSGASQGLVGNTLGLPVDVINSALGAVGLGSEKPVLGSEWIKEYVLPQKITPQGLGENILYGIGEQAGSMAVPGGILAKSVGGLLPMAKAVAPVAVRSGIGSGVAREYFPDNPYVDVAAQLAGGVSPKVAVNKLMSIAPNWERDMMVRALKPSSTLKTGEINKLAEDALNLPTSVTERGMNKNMGKVGDIGKVIDERLATVADNIDLKAAADMAYAKLAKQLSADNEAFPAAKLAQVKDEIDAWKLAHPEPVNAGVANTIRKSANTEIGPLFQAINKGDTAAIDRMWTTKTKAALSEATASLIGEKFPELKPLLGEQSKRLNLNKTIQTTVNNFKKSDVVSVFDVSAGAGAGAFMSPELAAFVAARVALKVMRTPAIRSHLAIGIRRARNATATNTGPFVPRDVQGNELLPPDAGTFNMSVPKVPLQIPFTPTEMPASYQIQPRKPLLNDLDESMRRTAMWAQRPKVSELPEGLLGGNTMATGNIMKQQQLQKSLQVLQNKFKGTAESPLPAIEAARKAAVKAYDTKVNKMAGELKAKNPGINYKEAVRLSKEAIGPME